MKQTLSSERAPKSLIHYINQTIQDIEQCILMLETQSIQSVEAPLLMHVLEKISLTTQAAFETLKVHTSSTDRVATGEKMQNLQVHLLSVFKAIKSSLKSHDKIMLTDLIEHELQDNLKQWKALIISNKIDK